MSTLFWVSMMGYIDCCAGNTPMHRDTHDEFDSKNPISNIVMAYVVMAYVVMAYSVMAYSFMAEFDSTTHGGGPRPRVVFWMSARSDIQKEDIWRVGTPLDMPAWVLRIRLADYTSAWAAFALYNDDTCVFGVT